MSNSTGYEKDNISTNDNEINDWDQESRQRKVHSLKSNKFWGKR